MIFLLSKKYQKEWNERFLEKKKRHKWNDEYRLPFNERVNADTVAVMK